jgi:hypothetical protein
MESLPLHHLMKRMARNKKSGTSWYFGYGYPPLVDNYGPEIKKILTSTKLDKGITTTLGYPTSSEWAKNIVARLKTDIQATISFYAKERKRKSVKDIPLISWGERVPKEA